MKSQFSTAFSTSLVTIAAIGVAVIPSSAQTTTVTTVVRHNHIRPQAPQVIHVVVNQQAVDFQDVEPIMVGGNAVLVPLRGVFEQLGGQLRWEPKTQVIEGARPGHQFRIRVGSDNALVNGSDKTLATPPRIIGATTYVPLRFASEALGATVAWDPDTQTATIVDTPAQQTIVKKTTTTTTTTAAPTE